MYLKGSFNQTFTTKKTNEIKTPIKRTMTTAAPMEAPIAIGRMALSVVASEVVIVVSAKVVDSVVGGSKFTIIMTYTLLLMVSVMIDSHNRHVAAI